MRKKVMIDGNEAAAYVAYRTNEVIAIYPITPSSNMGEWSDEWAAKGIKNIWGNVPLVQEMQSEGGASAAVHGALQAGSLTTTFTASQGLLLMIPTMFKVAGELTGTVFHISARSIAAQALSIFGDHSDIMATRATGFGIILSNSVQEVMDTALIAQAAALESRLPFIHAFDGFRVSHEVSKIEQLTEDDMRAMIDDELVRAHRLRGMSPDRPFIRGTSQNPDVYFQGRETVNPYYLQAPAIVQKAMDKFAAIVGRQYHLFDYVGAPDAERIIVLMGSGAETVEETVNALVAQGEKVGAVKVRLYRPFSPEHLLKALPETTRVVAVLDRTKEPGADGEPLYKDVSTALSEAFLDGRLPMASLPRVVGGRYGLSSKEFTPAMVKGVFDELAKEKPKNHFTVGIVDDVTHTSLDYDRSFSLDTGEGVRAMFWGLGADGTVGANKNSIKIIGQNTDYYAQGYFVYDSKKSNALTVSHLRFGPKPIQRPYLIEHANFIAVHQFNHIYRYPVLEKAEEGAVFLLNSPFGPDEVWDQLPRPLQETIIEKKLKFYVIDAYTVARETGMGTRINTIMQTGFFAISGVLPRDEAIAHIKAAIKKSYSRYGESVVRKNFAAVDAALDHLSEVKVPEKATSTFELPPVVPEDAPEFVKKVTATIIAGKGDQIPVSLMPCDGTFPSGTTQYEKSNIALDVPVWDEDLCIQCGKCVIVCPHAAIRAKVYEEHELEGAPPTFKAVEPRWKEFKGKGYKYTLQVAVEDCTGCGVCVAACPVKDKKVEGRRALNMAPQRPLRETERANWAFFLKLPDDTALKHNLKLSNVKNVQLLRPLFEFSGACIGCGETPYVRLLTQLFGDRAIIGNATGCSSIYGGNLPTTPYCTDKNGRGPAWNNSLFEDTAEFAFGMRLSLDRQQAYARLLLERLADDLGHDLVEALLSADQSDLAGIDAQRERVATLKARLAGREDRDAKDLLSVADSLVRRSVWGIGGDGWAYDIGYGGLDHVLAQQHNVNLLVLDTEVYSNTGGQASKATPRGAMAKFAFKGKPVPKKDLGAIAMTYGHIYVASVCMGANDAQVVKAFLEAEAYDGPSIIIAYSPCIAHGYNLANALEQGKRAVKAGHWPLYRYNPMLAREGKNPLKLDSKAPDLALKEYVYQEARFRAVRQFDPEWAEKLLKLAEEDIRRRWQRYDYLSKM